MELIAVVIAIVGVLVGVIGLARSVAGDRHGRQTRDQTDRFKSARAKLKTQRQQLADLAAGYYPNLALPGLPLLGRPEWLPDQPIPLDQVRLRAASPPPALPEPFAGHVWPDRGDGRRFDTYAAAIARLDPPLLFESRLSYRLTSVARADDGAFELAFGRCAYFDHVNSGESLGFELARCLDAGSLKPATSAAKAVPRQLAARRAVADPTDFLNRAALPGVNTLTLVVTGPDEATAWIHIRNSLVVAGAMGVYHVVPAGEFQPSGCGPVAFREDLDLWRNIMREYDEELGGSPEAAQQENGIRYDVGRYAAMEAARGHDLVPFFLGIGLDPLTFKPEILTACVFTKARFDSIFPEFPPRTTDHSEGSFFGVSFDEVAIASDVFADPSYGVLPAGAACLRLALRSRRDLIASVQHPAGRGSHKARNHGRAGEGHRDVAAQPS